MSSNGASSSSLPLVPDLIDETVTPPAERIISEVNPFLKHTGKEASTCTDCPKQHGLKLFVSPVGKPCAVCGKQMPNGDRAWRCFPCDFHMCIDCHDKGGKYDVGSVQLSGGYHNPGWDGKAMDPFGDNIKREVGQLKDLLTKYAESTRLQIVNCKNVIPDYSNRGHTGLSVEHVHKVSQSMAKGFRERDITENDAKTGHVGYDIPVLVRETTQSSEENGRGLGKESLKNWTGVVLENGTGFPKPSIHLLRKSQDVEVYCSLGNGHFFQALNNYRTGNKSIWTNANPRPDGEAYVEEYKVPEEDGANPLLRDHVLNGVPSLILRPEISLKERTTICELLNKKSDYRWTLTKGPDYDPVTNRKDLIVDLDSLKEVDVKQSQFELLSKTLYAMQKYRTRIAIMDYKSFSPGKSALEILSLMLRKFVMHLNEYDTFAQDTLDGLELNCLVRQEEGQTNSSNVGK
ncbi:unnamed protein product [Amoebophrya sp. A120]|nr:unnamed protein product [Amoebophrya sp. A120]|eukprot:GSA120T00013517001.1